MSKKIRYACLFSGIGAPLQGAYRVYGKENIEHVFSCEWDKFARESFKANYEIEDEHFHKDIADMDGTQYKGKVDILIGGSPCQDFSLAGLRKGIDGNKGILIYEYIRIVEEVKAPVIVYENVKGMLSDKGGRTIKEFVQALRDIGYHCHYDIVNTKDYGVPQNRERLFLVGFLDHEAYHRFEFAPKMPLEKRLKDVLESDVDEKYYLSEKGISGFINHTGRMRERGNGFSFTPTDGNKIASSITTKAGSRPNDNFIQVQSATKQGYEEATIGDSINLTHPDSKTRRVRVGKQAAQTLDCACNQAMLEDYRIRKLTPLECFRLQDFPDEALHKAQQAGVSSSQLYKQAGNSMSVNVLEMIFNQIERAKNGEAPEGSLF